MKKPSLCWVTADYFLDCDLRPQVLNLISLSFSIHMIVVFPFGKCRYSESEVNSVREQVDDVSFDFIYMKYRHRDLRSLRDFRKLRDRISSYNPDLIYLNISFAEPHPIPMLFRLPANRTLVSAHQGIIHEGMNHKLLISLSRNVAYNRMRNVIMFSKSQSSLFKEAFPKSHVFLNPLGLKWFGSPTIHRDTNSPIVRFLAFGTINYAKNLDLLIDAAEGLYDEGVRGFVVSINGMCSDWSRYASRIRHPALFELDIRMIPNDVIPDLFENSHFFVQPYRAVSQSGPLKIAYAYNLPVIVSDLPGFTDEVEEGVSGFVFKTGDKGDLIRALKCAMDCYNKDYSSLLQSMKQYVDEHYSDEASSKNYNDIFNCLIADVKQA